MSLTTSIETIPTHHPRLSRWVSARTAARRLLPGVALCTAVALAATGAERIETALLGRAWLEPLVLAIVIGTAVRSMWALTPMWCAGVGFSAKTLLEVAVMLLGASISFAALADIGPALLGGIAAVVALAILTSFGLGRALGLPHRMAVLVACGNGICGNSAIAAVAPVIGADAAEIATAIAFTAVLGVVVVLGLPLGAALVGSSATQAGVFAGLTVYAVPQVLAATAPLGSVATQVGTLVKLVRVLMLGPVVLMLSLVGRRRTGAPVALHAMVPWFIVGFLGLAALRSFGLIPTAALAPVAIVGNALTVMSMAALGLGVDVRVVARAGGRVTAAVCLSLIALGLISFGLIRGLGLA